MALWLRICACSAEGTGYIAGWGSKILHVTKRDRKIKWSFLNNDISVSTRIFQLKLFTSVVNYNILRLTKFFVVIHCPAMFNSVTPWTAAHQASLSLTISQSLPKFMSTALVMPSSHLILWGPLLLLPSIFPSTRDFSNESPVRIRWSKD